MSQPRKLLQVHPNTSRARTKKATSKLSASAQAATDGSKKKMWWRLWKEKN